MAHNRRFLYSPQPRHLTTPPASLADALREHYTLERELGRGGMATVYLARDLKHGRMVALKVLRPELAHVLGPERFLREIEIAARLQHPMILPVFGCVATSVGWKDSMPVAMKSVKVPPLANVASRAPSRV